MDSYLAEILVGLSVNISRSDGRVHPANIKTVDQSKGCVKVEWYEESNVRGKEIEVDELWTLNKELLDHMLSSCRPSAKPLAEPPAVKNYEGRLRSSRIPARSNPPVDPAKESVPRKTMARQTCLFRPHAPVAGPVDIKPEPLSPESSITVPKMAGAARQTQRKDDDRQMFAMPQISKAFKENEETKPTLTGLASRKKPVLPQELNKVNKRVSYALKPADPQNKKGKFGDTVRPHKQFYLMIEEFRETLSKVPMSASDLVKEHRICVCVRKRPLNKQEVTKKEIDVVSIPGNGVLLVHEPKTKVDLTKYLDNQVFHFDYSFDESSTNDLVYRFSAKPLVETIFEGGMATCFAYGQTGSGKTHTMGGDFNGKSQNSSKGIYALAAQDVFTLLSQRRYSSMDLSPYVTFFEIYNGKVYDLLNKKAMLRVLEDEKQQVQVVGLQEMGVSCSDDVIRMIQIGSACRTSGQTSANANSSRSHAILQVILRRKNKLHGKFSLVDLAGNERGVDVSSNDRATLMETSEINRSLLALKECIRSLGQNSDHIPFRMSKLTLVLRDSFIGESSRTCMITMVSPGMASCDYTLNTLRYADRVKELNGSSKACENDIPKRAETPMEEEDSEEDTLTPMTSVYEAIAQVSRSAHLVQENVHKITGELPMEKTLFEIETDASELEEYVTTLLERIRALKSAISDEMITRMAP